MVGRMSSNFELYCRIASESVSFETPAGGINIKHNSGGHRIPGNAFIVVVLAVEQAWGEAEAHRTYWPIPS